MELHDLITIAAILIAGFWTIHKELTAIRVAISEKVTYEDCSKKRDKCPLEDRIKNIEEKMK